MLFNLLLSLAVSRLLVGALAEGGCKCAPTDSCWPSASTWQTLNATLSGRLIRTAPPGSVCYPSWPDYNEDACEDVLSSWSTSSFHSADPVSIDWPVWANHSCDPIFPNGTSIAGNPAAGEIGCSVGEYPQYVVNATEVAHVQAALSFAKTWNLRLVIKNTGHADGGRNVAYGGLSIWTHHMKSFQFHQSFQPALCQSNDTLMAATIGAGMQSHELFEAVGEHGALAVGGTNPDVGFVGWSAGGGHGFMTGSYGMGADNIIQATIVTMNGTILTANACQNTDIFWAIRGGGGGTFGVVIDVTVKAYPSISVATSTLVIAPINSTTASAWWSTIARLHALFPQIQDQGVHGYYTITGPPTSSTIVFSATLYLWNGTTSGMENILVPLKRFLNSVNDTISSTISYSYYPTFMDLIGNITDNETVGVITGISASRLVTRPAVANTTFLAEILQQVGPLDEEPENGIPNLIISGVMTASRRPVDNALNPAWRDTVVHLLTAQEWEGYLPESEVHEIVQDITYNKLDALRRLDPSSGAYFNEANPYEPGWQFSFFSSNYNRLLSVKKKYDPDGMLWCRRCVGSEAWSEQEDGRLCPNYQPF